jgi:hypothetical protein
MNTAGGSRSKRVPITRVGSQLPYGRAPSGRHVLGDPDVSSERGRRAGSTGPDRGMSDHLRWWPAA